MRPLILGIALSVPLTLFAENGDAVPQQPVQNANTEVTAPGEESAVSLERADALVATADSMPGDSLAAAWLQEAAEHYRSAGVCERELEVQLRILEEHPHSPEAAQAFESAWDHVTRQGEEPLAGAELALSRAAQAEDPGESVRAFRLGFGAYVEAGMWNLASEAGQRFLRESTLSDHDLSLEIAAACLKAGDSEQAIVALNQVLDGDARHPSTVRARTELGLIHRALGSHAEANDHFARAWTTYQKMRKRPGFDDPRVRWAASRSLWESLEWERADVEKTLAGTIDPDHRSIRRALRRLESGYQEVAVTEPSYSPQSQVRTGDLRFALGDARLREGYDRSVGDRTARGPNPYDEAMPEYEQARLAYTRAWQSTQDIDLSGYGSHWSEGVFDWDRQAVRRVHGTHLRQAQIIYEWSQDIWRHAPDRGFGEGGLEQRFDLLVNRVIPLVRESLENRGHAVVLAERNPQLFAAADSRVGMDEQVQRVSDALIRLCRTQWNGTRSTATQLVQTLSILGEPDAGTSLYESLSQQLQYSGKYWEEGAAGLADLWESVLGCGPNTELQNQWQADLIEFNGQYANLSRTVHEHLEACTADMDSYDPVMKTLKSRLRSLGKRAQRAEREALDLACEIARRFEIRHEVYADVYDRLHEIDPIAYPIANTRQSAQR